jgi:hypothetical protein
VGDRFGPDAKDQHDMLVRFHFPACRIVSIDGFGSNRVLTLVTKGSFIRHGLPQKQCEAEILAHLVAGSDTTANFLRVTLFLLVTTPRVYYQLQMEIDDGITSGKISNPITGAEGKRLPYLQVQSNQVSRNKL